jgi:DNA-binding CsgD family transcriptional regulator
MYMQSLSKPELISALDFIFNTHKVTDSTLLYESLEKLARDTFHCDELVIGTCSDEAVSVKCQTKSANVSCNNPNINSQAVSAPPNQTTSDLSSSCLARSSSANAKPSSSVSRINDGIMVCNYSATAPLLCAAFTGKDKPLFEDQHLLDGLIPYLAATIDRISLNKTQATQHSEHKKPIFLTARETEVLHWVAVGKSCDETGSILGVTERTVKFHLQNVYRKLDVVNRAQAVTVAHQHALL